MNRFLLGTALLVTGFFHATAQSDLCSGAPLLNVNSGCTSVGYTIQGSWGAEMPNPSCGVNYRDGFFRFIAVSTQTSVQVTDGSGGPDPILVVYSGTCGSLTQIGCSNEGNNDNENVTVATAIGQTYYVAIMRHNNASANAINGQICVKQGTAPPPNTDCANAMQVCNTAAFGGNANGLGVDELTNATDGCLSGENQSSWYYFQAATAGTVTFTIQTNADYDFAIWNNGCASLGAPIRCSFSGTAGNTGLQVGAGDDTEDASGNRFVNALDVTAGQTYILLVDNWDEDNTPFNIAWNFTNGATLNCNPIALPVEFAEFTGTKQNGYNELSWVTASERENDYFTLERSTDGVTWQVVAKPDGAGNSMVATEYTYTDFNFQEDAVNYYRISQTDMDGASETYSKLVSIDNRQEKRIVTKRFNLLGQEVGEDYKGVVILQFEDNSCVKAYQ